MVSPNIVKKIPIAIGIKPDQPTTFTNKTLDFGTGNGNVISNVPTSALQYNTITINNTAIPLGGSISIQAQGGSAIIDTDTTYTFTATTQSNGARLNLTAGGSGVGSQGITIQQEGNIVVTQVDSQTIKIGDSSSLGGVAITDSSTSTLTNKSINGNDNTLTNIQNTSLANNSITINNTDVELGGSITIAGGGGSGDLTSSGIATLSNKTISGSNNTITDLPNSALTNNSISINGTPVELGTNFNVSGLGDVTLAGEQTLSNKGLLNPVVQEIELIGTLSVGQGNGANPGQNGQWLKSTATGIIWENQGAITAGAVAGDLTSGSGISFSSGTTYNGSNGLTISVDASVIATLTGTQTLTNKTLTAPDLSGDLQIDGVSGSAGDTIVSDGAGGLAWGAGGGGGGGGSFNGPGTSTDNAIARYDGTTGALAQNSLVTISDTGAITAPATSSVIPFLYSNQFAFPDASTYHGAIAHSHSDGAMYFAHSGSWQRLANSTEVSIASRATFTDQSPNLANNGTDYPDIAAYKSYLLLKIQVDKAAWVRVYTSKAARSADASRSIDVDPQPGSGVLAEIITTGAQTQVLTPSVIGFNDEASPVAEIYLAVTNRSGSANPITTTLTALKLEA